VFLQPKREASLRKQEHNAKKLHVIDTGLIAAYQTFPNRDLGHKLENVVFLENRRSCKDLFYYANGSREQTLRLKWIVESQEGSPGISLVRTGHVFNRSFLTRKVNLCRKGASA
jgi:hypothetical protein